MAQITVIRSGDGEAISERDSSMPSADGVIVLGFVLLAVWIACGALGLFQLS